MKIRAKVGGELNRPVHWIHAAGDEREFPEEVGKKILTNENYEVAGARKDTSEKEITAKAMVKKDSGKKEKREGN